MTMALINVINASKREIHSFYNTLVCVPKTFENSYTCIDLIDECYATGKIIVVDGFMNLQMEDVVLCNRNGNRRHFDNLYIRGRQITCIHTPETAEKSAIDMLKDQIDFMTRKNKKSRKKTFKIKRAERQNAETIASAYNAKE